ncbi:MAG: hypothetical protein GXP54_09435 [Deltaproteobacteria bacterium]|nr:hypothetical protein [Deltaproteobacteria bacterium]
MRLSSTVAVSCSLVFTLWTGAVIAGEHVIGPEMGPVISDIFHFKCGWQVDEITVRKDMAVATARMENGTSCEVRLIHPDAAAPDGFLRTLTPEFAVLSAPSCPPECVEALIRNARSASKAFTWKEPRDKDERVQGTVGGGTGSICVTAGVGLAAVLALMYLGFIAFRGLVRLPGGRMAAIVLTAGAAILAVRALNAPIQTGDELINFTSSLTGAFTLFDLVEYPHPALYFNLSSALYGLYTVLLSVSKGCSLDAAAAQAMLFHHSDLLMVSRLLSVLFWAGLMGTVYAMAVGLTRDRWSSLLAMVLILPTAPVYSSSFSPYTMGVFLSYLALYLWTLDKSSTPADKLGVTGAGVLAGAALSAHYLSVLFMPAFIPALFRNPAKRRPALFALFAATAVVVFLIVDFRMFLDFQGFLDSWAWRVSEITTPDVTDINRHLRAASTGSPLFYIRLLISSPLLPFALVGLATSIARLILDRDTDRLVAIILPLYLLVALSAPATKFERYLIFVYPSMAVLGACGVSDILEWLKIGRPRPFVVLALAGMTAFFPAKPARLVLDPGPGGALIQRQSDPVARFLKWVKDATNEGQIVGVSCPDLPHPARAFRERRMPAGIAFELADLLTKTTDRKVIWIDAGKGSSGPGTGLESIDWLYLIYWYDNDKPDIGTLQRSAHVRLEKVSSAVSNGLRHMIYRVTKIAREGIDAPSTAPPGTGPVMTPAHHNTEDSTK